jgi:hypothetical protein
MDPDIGMGAWLHPAIIFEGGMFGCVELLHMPHDAHLPVHLAGLQV